MRTSAGVNEAREKFYKYHITSAHYDFGGTGLLRAGLNPIRQFVGSFDWKIQVVGNTLVYTLTNKTGLWSAALHLTPKSWDHPIGPMGDFYQTYIFTEPLRK
jgi:hypothetical protein